MKLTTTQRDHLYHSSFRTQRAFGSIRDNYHERQVRCEALQPLARWSNRSVALARFSVVRVDSDGDYNETQGGQIRNDDDKNAGRSEQSRSDKGRNSRRFAREWRDTRRSEKMRVASSAEPRLCSSRRAAVAAVCLQNQSDTKPSCVNPRGLCPRETTCAWP